MTFNIDKSPFYELPQALIEDMLNQCDDIGTKLRNSFQKLYDTKKDIRQLLKERNLLRKDSEIIYSPQNPTTCGVDGSFSIEKLLSTDIVATASLAVEGLAPPSEVRFWPDPRHYSKIFTIPHNSYTSVMTRAIMMCMELSLAVKAPHNVVFFDGSLLTPSLILSQASNIIIGAPEELKKDLMKRLNIALAAYLKIIISKKTDQIFAGVPKYTTVQEVTQRVLKLSGYEDRGLLSFVLKTGEFLGPLKTEKQIRRWNYENLPQTSHSLLDRAFNSLDDLHFFYYRPYDHMPVLRLEISPAIAFNKNRLSMLFEAIKLQCGIPGVMEPFPLYLADRMVKHLRTAIPAIRKTTTQEMSLKWEGSHGDLYFAMHGYRTEWGK